MNLRARSSRVTGPKMRVPIGSPCFVMRTAALRSKRMALPSGRRISFAVRTITAWCTSPFLTRPRGIASLTETTMTSPTEAYLRLEPPSTLMHMTRRAPELSATSRLLCIWIIGSGSRALGDDGVVGQHFPALGLGQRTRLLDAHAVTDLAAVGLVVRRVLFRARDELLVDRMHDAALDLDRDGLVALVAHHRAPHDSLGHCSYSSPALLRRGLLGQSGLDARDVTTHHADPRRVLELARGPLEAQVELLLLERPELVLQLVVGLEPHITSLHGLAPLADALHEARGDRQLG